MFTRGDTFPNGTRAGDIFIDVDPKYRQGSVVTATFWACNPRHNTLGMLEDSFLGVQQPNGRLWQTIFTDTDWSTRFYWETDHTGAMMANRATVYWEIPEDQATGTYRLTHKGWTKAGVIIPSPSLPYSGTSAEFEVVLKNYTRPQ
eukprot:XP_011683148.1 PREDICTED: neutral ceramidase-like [Strongylocentrotus purpuratus]